MCSASLRVMEIRCIITLRFCTNLGRMTKIKETTDDKCCWACGGGNPQSLFVELQTVQTTLDISVENSQ